MEIFEAKKIADETLTVGHPHRVSKLNLEETVGDVDLGAAVVTTTVVEKTEVVTMVQDDKEDELMKNVEHEEEGVFGNLIDVNCSANETSVAMDVDDSLEICLSVEENVENREDNGEKLAENEGKEHEEHEKHGFAVGDFVWGKIKSHPWWPGQIYNASDASDNALRLKHKGLILVAHFGDGSFSWCTASQLKPFIDDFEEMSKQSDSKKFVNAVQTALGEVSRLVEAGLMCKCQTVNQVDHSVVVNRGVKAGVPVPNGNTIKVLLEKIKPVQLLKTLKDSAMMDPGAGRAELELTLLKSCLSTFYSQKGGYLLVKHHNPMCIEGLEDELRSGVVANFVADTDNNDPSKSVDNGNNKPYQKRKQKSVAELLLREDDPMKIKKPIIAKDGGSGKRKRKTLVVSVTPESDHESGGGGGGVEDETMSPRQRKKSKYLSPPYLSPVGPGRLSVLGSGSFKEPKPKDESESKPEKVPETAAKRLEDSLNKSSRNKTRQNRSVNKGSEEEPKSMARAGVNVNKVLHGLLRVALDPASFNDKNAPAVTDFISSYRSSIYKEGSRHGKEDRDRDIEFMKQKLESMIGIVRGCEETELRADLKASLEGGMQEVLEKVGKMKGE